MFFNDLEKELEKFNWKMNYEIKSNNPFYEVIFEKCKLLFYRNKKYSSIECYLKPLGNISISASYSIAEILKFKKKQFPELYNNHSSVDESKYIEQYVKIIFDVLLNEINGDFKVFHIIDEHDRNVHIIQDKLGTSFIFQTDIYKKMEKGDASWRIDLDNIK